MREASNIKKRLATGKQNVNERVAKRAEISGLAVVCERGKQRISPRHGRMSGRSIAPISQFTRRAA